MTPPPAAPAVERTPTMMRGLLALIEQRPAVLAGLVEPHPGHLHANAAHAVARLRAAPAGHLHAIFAWLHTNAALPVGAFRRGLADAAFLDGADLTEVRMTLFAVTDLLSLGCDLAPVLDPEQAALVAHIGPEHLAAALAAGLSATEIAAGVPDQALHVLLGLRGVRP